MKGGVHLKQVHNIIQPLKNEIMNLKSKIVDLNNSVHDIKERSGIGGRRKKRTRRRRMSRRKSKGRKRRRKSRRKKTRRKKTRRKKSKRRGSGNNLGIPQVGMIYQLTDEGLEEEYPPLPDGYTITRIAGNYIYFNNGTFEDEDLYVPKNLLHTYFRPI